MPLLKIALFSLLILFSTFIDNNDVQASQSATTQTNESFVVPLCKIILNLQGPWGRALLLLGTIFIGVNVLMGKFSMALLLSYIAAVMLIINPHTIVNLMTGKDFDCEKLLQKLQSGASGG